MKQHLDRVRMGLARQSAQAEYEQERFTAQMQFAEFLCGHHPVQADEWRGLIEKASALVADATENGADDLSKSVRQAEEILAPIGAVCKQYTIYCVGHAHIDMNWMWSWPETVATTNDTFTTVLRLMEEFPEFVFSQSQASVYKIVEDTNPELLKRIVEHVKEGRWEVTASHWVEGDKNIASGESLCRHLLYARRYMQTLFGLSPEDIAIDWSPDTFGHAHTVPTYLVRGGVRYSYMHRPGVHTEPQPRPGAFWWKAPDGSQVLVRNDMRLGYNGQIGPHIVPTSLQPFVQETGLKFTMFVYGVGDHGGGPTRRDLMRMTDLDTWPIYPNVKAARADEFYQRLENEGQALPVIDDELNFEFSGCFTSQSLVKKSNRYGEKKLVDAEAASAFAWVTKARAYPQATLEEGWRDTLFSHFHDILPGSGVHDTRTYTHGLYQKTVAMTGVQEMEALRALASKVDTSNARVEVEHVLPSSRYPTAMGSGIGRNSADGNCSQYALGKGSDHRPFLVFNPTSQERAEVIEAVVWDSAWGWELKDLNTIPFSVQTPDGTLIPAQRIETGDYWGHRFVRLAFPVTVPPLGYALYTVKEEVTGASANAQQIGLQHQCGYSFYERSPEGLENELIRVDLDTQTGGIKSLVDRRSGAALIDPSDPAAILEYGVERNRSMNSWLIEHVNAWRHLELVAIRRGLNGPYKATMEVDLRIEQSDLTLVYELRTGDPTLYLHIRGTWFQRGSHQGVPVLRFSAPLALAQPSVSYEIPFGGIEREMAHGEEVPALRWAQVSGTCAGKPSSMLLLNDSKHGHTFEENRLSLTLIRSSTNPDPLPEIGQHEIHLGLCPVDGGAQVGGAIQRGRAFNHELKVVSTDAHDGELSAQASFIKIGSDTVVLDTVKKAESEEAFILRLYEPMGEDATTKVILNEQLTGKVKQVLPVDLMERPAGDPLPVEGGAFSISIPARGICSVMVSLEQ